MNYERCEELHEALFDVDESIIGRAYEINDAEKLRVYIRAKEGAKPRPYSLSLVFRLAAAAVFFLIISRAVWLAIPKATTQPPLNTENETGLKATEADFVVCGDDDFSFKNNSQNFDGFTSEGGARDPLEEPACLSPLLQEKMTLFQNEPAVFYVHVFIKSGASENDRAKLEEASALSRVKPIPFAEETVGGAVFCMELTAEDILSLVKKGGYAFRLAPKE